MGTLRGTWILLENVQYSVYLYVSSRGSLVISISESRPKKHFSNGNAKKRLWKTSNSSRGNFSGLKRWLLLQGCKDFTISTTQIMPRLLARLSITLNLCTFEAIQNLCDLKGVLVCPMFYTPFCLDGLLRSTLGGNTWKPMG